MIVFKNILQQKNYLLNNDNSKVIFAYDEFNLIFQLNEHSYPTHLCYVPHKIIS